MAQLSNGRFASTDAPFGRPVLLDHTGRPVRSAQNKIPDGGGSPGGLALPNGFLFVGRVGGGDNTMWLDRFDEAVRQSRADARDMLNDCQIRALLFERMRSVATLKWHIEVPDEKDRAQIRVKDGLTRLVKGLQSKLTRILWTLLEGIWYGRSAVQVNWKWCDLRDEAQQAQALQMMREDRVCQYLRQAVQRDPRDQKARTALQERERELGRQAPAAGRAKQTHRKIRALTIDSAMPVNGDSIGHQYDGTPFVLVDSALDDASIVSTTLGRALSLRGTWRERFLISRWFQEQRDFFTPDEAEAVYGVGVRSHVFWTKWMKMEWLGNISDFFARVGLGVNVWKYRAGSPAARAAVEQAAKDNTDRANIFVPVVEGEEAVDVLTRVEVPTSGAEVLLKLIEYADKSMERYIVGQEGSASATSGSGHSNDGSNKFMMDTKLQITKLDAAWAAECLTGDDRDPGLLSMMGKYTYPEADFPYWWVFDVENDESKERLDAIKTLVDMGVKVKADDARTRAGVSKPADGEELITPPQPPGMPGGAAPGGGAAEGAEGGLPGAPGGEEEPAQPQGEAKQPAGEGGAAEQALPPVVPDHSGDFAAALRQMREEMQEVMRFVKGGGKETTIPLNSPVAKEGPAVARRLAQAMQHLRERGRDDLADELVLAFARRYAKEDAKHHLHDDGSGRFVAKGQGDSAGKQDKPGERTTPREAPAARREEGTVQPNRPMSPQQARDSLENSPVKKSETLKGGCNATSLLTTEDGAMGVYKPASGERPHLREGIPGGGYWRREIAASRVAEALGFDDLVPTTTERRQGKDVGSIQRYVYGAYEGAKYAKGERFDGKVDAARAAAFDFLVGNTDRHCGNWLLQEGKLWLIDNGLCFPTHYARTDWVNHQFLRHADDKDLELPDLTGLKDRWPQVEKVLQDAGIEKEAIALTKERFDAVTAKKGLKAADLPVPDAANEKWWGRRTDWQEGRTT